MMSCGDGGGSNRHAVEEFAPGTPPAYNKLSRGLFMSWSFKSFGSMTDGSSNTIAASETVSNPNAPTGQDLKGAVYELNNFYLKSAGDCAIDARSGAPRGQINTPVAATWRGQTFGDGRPIPSGFCTIIPPNGPSCSASNDNDWGTPTANSHHAGGVNSIFADGSGRFITETINTNLSLTISIVDDGISGESPYGVWGALGTPSGHESVQIP
jgi:hypothetical protein